MTASLSLRRSALLIAVPSALGIAAGWLLLSRTSVFGVVVVCLAAANGYPKAHSP
jgi:hypothetical protein